MTPEDKDLLKLWAVLVATAVSCALMLRFALEAMP